MTKFVHAFVLFSVAVPLLSVPASGQEVLGLLDGTIASQLRTGWEGREQDGWFVLRNKDGVEDAEQTLTIPSGPIRSDGRHIEVNVSINSTQDDAAIGLILRNRDKKSSCVGELTSKGTAQLFCSVDGTFTSIATVENAGKMDGKDMLFMFEIEGAARFMVNDQVIGDIEVESALASEMGIITYGRGTFGLADFLVEDITFDDAPDEGSGLPPRGGAAAGTASDEQAPETPTTGDRLRARMGVLTQAILEEDDPEGWQSFVEDKWFVLVNEATPSSEIFYTMPVGPLESGQREVSVGVGILAPKDEDPADFPYSAAGLLVENGKHSCLGEITLGGDGLVFCFDEEGKRTEMGRFAGAALGDGRDVVQLIERPGRASFLLNGKIIADLDNHPAMGGDVGVLAYERGEFFFDAFAVNMSADTASASSGQEDDLPDFGDDEFRFIGAYVGITNGIFLHEFGHALIGELQVPSTGPEEDAVDIFSALRVVEPTTFPSDNADVNEIGRQVALYSVLPWYFGGMLDSSGGASMPWQDEHTHDLKRFRNTFCVIYGGNPQLYGDIAGQVGLDERTLARCEEEFTRQNRAWRSILAAHTRMGPWHPEGLVPADAPGASINVTFEEPTTSLTFLLVNAFEDYIRGFAKSIEENYVLPRDINVTYKNCGELNAWYDPREGSITMCYELIEHLIRMVADVDLGEIGGITPAASTTVAPAQADIEPMLNELADYGVPATHVLFPAPYRGPTPTQHVRAEVVTTEALVGMITSGKPILLVDTIGGDDTLPEAFAVRDSGRDGSLTDGFQTRVRAWLEEETGGDTTIPIVFFGADMLDRSSYNAALRAGNLGWNAYWYRGGIEAWRANGLPMASELQK